MTWAEIKSQLLNRLSHPGAPETMNLKHMPKPWETSMSIVERHNRALTGYSIQVILCPISSNETPKEMKRNLSGL